MFCCCSEIAFVRRELTLPYYIVPLSVLLSNRATYLERFCNDSGRFLKLLQSCYHLFFSNSLAYKVRKQASLAWHAFPGSAWHDAMAVVVSTNHVCSV